MWLHISFECNGPISRYIQRQKTPWHNISFEVLCLEDDGRGPCEQDARVQVQDSNHCEHFLVEGRNVMHEVVKLWKERLKATWVKERNMNTNTCTHKRQATCTKGRNTKKWLAAWSILLQASWRSVGTHRRWIPSECLLCFFVQNVASIRSANFASLFKTWLWSEV